ncbi:hypothetical protein K443DRAFT_685415 [Laccaria amethystina LaAM-08-1]|uniref:Uncharacterized protein n=1 Tax=Laccaria amethystina LaAM-08-1 TaxID=1095629 RepID=A0A0C9WUJ5_9AGAR|nr:hypothetical protein K443DRAFT_685415 [Laccaria amethystina LaAM-08-1]
MRIAVVMGSGMGMKMEMTRTDPVRVVHLLAMYTTARSRAGSWLNYEAVRPNSTQAMPHPPCAVIVEIW